MTRRPGSYKPRTYQGRLVPYLDEIRRMVDDKMPPAQIAAHLNETYRAKITYQHIRYALRRLGWPIYFEDRIEHTPHSRTIYNKISQLLDRLTPRERRAVMFDLQIGRD